MRRHKRLVKLLSIITITFFLLSNILTPVWAGQPAMQNTFAAPGVIDPFGPLDPGGWAGMKPDPQAGIQDMAASLVPKSVPVDVKALNGLSGSPGDVSVTSGELIMELDELTVPSPNLPLRLKRVFTGQQEEPGPLGYGWTFSYNQYLQMYEEFKIVEYRGDGNHQVYNYTENNPDAMVPSYDGDPLIYYNLDDGYYTPASQANTGALTRHSGDSYSIRAKDGTVYHYAGYKAAWRSGQSPGAGKLTAIEDRNGNRVTLTYDENGNLKQVQDAFGRTLIFQYTVVSRAIWQ